MASIGALAPQVSWAQKTCASVYNTFDSAANRRGFYNYIEKTGYKAPDTVTVKDSNGNTFAIPIPEHLKNFLHPAKQLNIASMGVLGDIFDLVPSPATGKTVFQQNAWRTHEVKTRTEELLKKAPETVPVSVMDLVRNSVDVRELTDQTVLVTAKLVSQKFLTGLPQAILHRFQKVGLSSVTFVYRQSGLEPNEPLTGFTMLDETVEIIKNQRGFSFHLLYDKAVWEMELKAIAARVQQFENAKSDEEKSSVISSMNQLSEPFLPFSGIVTTEWPFPGAKPVELKRYFSNELEDPLHFTVTSPKNEFKLRHQMLYKVIEEMPPKTTMEVHAHTVAHKRAYTKLGLKVIKEEINPLYPDVTVYVLAGLREDMLEALSAILNKTE
jgi:hypothetical protein